MVRGKRLDRRGRGGALTHADRPRMNTDMRGDTDIAGHVERVG